MSVGAQRKNKQGVPFTQNTGTTKLQYNKISNKN